MKEKDIAALSAKAQAHLEKERKLKGGTGALLSDVILGGQDGLVNVLGIVLGVASATSDRFIVLIAGLVATFAESVSMAAVAYASSRAEADHYRRELENEKWEMENLPDIETEEVRIIYMRKGYRGKKLEQMVKNTCSNKEMWLSIMMAEELGLTPPEDAAPLRAAVIVGGSALVGSLIPLIPFIFFSVSDALLPSLILSTVVLFGVGIYKAKITVGNWLKSGIEMAAVGMIAALVGYFVGKVLGDFFGLKNIPA
ncbi:MAG: VIT1/CCC1 transporter family protein [Candidatus Micrarchaeota archaeon]|nr:VIT1/CCC1 transporter family protein [Candidatus Micrarchaeota archaeon]